MGMRTADGMICSTSWLAGRYRSFNKNTWECRNGIDLNRYDYKRPDRHGMVTIGFAGGVGHKASLARWEPALRSVMRQRENVRFVSVGAPAAAAFVEEFGRERAIAYPSATIEVYPASMTLFDISFAPSAENNQFRGKSDLRWLETSALGIPLVAHPDVYPDIEDGVTGVHATHAAGGRGGAAAARRRPGGARAHRQSGAPSKSPSTGASRSRPRAGPRCCARPAPVPAPASEFEAGHPLRPTPIIRPQIISTGLFGPADYLGRAKDGAARST